MLSIKEEEDGHDIMAQVELTVQNLTEFLDDLGITNDSEAGRCMALFPDSDMGRLVELHYRLIKEKG